MKKQNLLYLLSFLCVFFLLSSVFFGEGYYRFYKDQQSSRKYYQDIQELDISTTAFGEALSSDEIELMVFPDTAHLEYLEDRILSAQEEILVEVYIFTEKRLRDALISVSERGIPVKILLENNPYMAPSINDSHFDDFAEAGIDVRWGDSSDYSLNHSKLLIIDDEVFVSTGNFSYSLFTKNTDFMLHIQNKELHDVFRELFFYDYAGEKRGVFHEKLVLSPDYSRDKLEYLITQSKERIDMYFPYINDDNFIRELSLAEEKGVEVRIIVEEDFYEEEEELVRDLKGLGMEILPYTQGHLHAKAMLFDEEILYIGSINFSSYSFDKNREIGLLLTSQEILEQFMEIYQNDL